MSTINTIKNICIKFVSVSVLIFAFLTTTQADDTLSKDSVNELTLKYNKVKSSVDGEGEQFTAELEMYRQYNITDNLSFTGELGLYHYPASYLPSLNRYSPSGNIVTLNECLLNLTLNPISEDLVLSVGQISSSDGAFSSVKTNNVIKSDLLFTLSDNVGQGAFLTYNQLSNINKYRVRLGYVSADYYPFDNAEKYNKRLKDSSGKYLEYYYNYKKFEFIYNYVDMDIIFDNVHYFDNESHAIGIKYDDSDESGFIIHGIYGISETDGIETDIVNHPVYNIPVKVDIDRDGKGYHRLFGTKYIFDAFKFENFIGFENYYASRKSMVFSAGSPYSEYGLGALGEVNTIYVGTNINSRLNISLTKKVTEYEYYHEYMGPQKYADKRIDKEYYIVLKYLF